MANSLNKPGDYRIGHASMLARNILKIAPDAAIYDLPIIPPEIDDNQKFLSTVHAAFDQVVETIHYLKSEDKNPRWQRPWIFVNAWATYNTAGESPPGDYTKHSEHKFNRLITRMVDEFDMVFAAGNCGQFCPSRRCGVNDVGPAHSIIGANSLANVLTVGAVRADGMWLGYSSQGPGTLSREKPDLCAASQFCENDDAATVNTGTSAACASVAGVVARLRRDYDTRVLCTAKLKRILIETTTAKPPGGWDRQIGHGIINVAGALERARQKCSLDALKAVASASAVASVAGVGDGEQDCGRPDS
jgi:subtilisin family serine protease